MPQPNGTIVESNRVALFGHFANAFTRLYDSAIMERVIVERISYISDGLRVTGYIARPKREGVYPVLLWNRGGYKERGALENLTAWLILATTADWGYVVLATQYRGNADGEGEEDWGGKDVDDAMNMLEVARNIPACDLNRVAIEGASRGGMTTYRALAHDSRFRCGIVHAGLSDVVAAREHSERFREFSDRRLAGLSDEEKLNTLRSISAVYFADKLPKTTPLLLMHGTADEIVPLSQTTALMKELDRFGVPYQFEQIENGGHVALRDGSYKAIDNHRQKWLKRYLS